MAGAALNQNAELINSLMGAAKGLLGSDTSTKISNSGTTTTKQTILSPDAINALLKSLMEGTTGRPGLAAVSGGQRAPGLYNTTSRQLLVNDLLARSAAETAKASAKETTTATGNQQLQQVKVPGMGKQALIGGAALLLGTDSGRKKLKDLFGLADIADVSKLGTSGEVLDSAGSIMSGSITGGSELGDFLNADLTGGFMTSPGASAITDMGTAATDSLMSDFGFDSLSLDGTPVVGPALKLFSGDVTGSIGSIGGYAVGNTMLPGIGGPIGSFVGSELMDPAISFAGDALSGIGDVIGGLFDGCFITTAICKLYDKPDDCYELETLRKYRDGWLKENYPEDIKEYYSIAPAIVSAIDLREDSDEVWSTLYNQYLLKAINCIENGNYSSAHSVYRAMVDVAKGYANGR